MATEIMRVSSKGQLTIPVSIRKQLKIKEGDYLKISIDQNEIRLKKIEPVQPLGPDDPIWKMIGIVESGSRDVSVNHDQYLAKGETERWKK
jgi:transcriptional pleiotropic regulator of transition state genes